MLRTERNMKHLKHLVLLHISMTEHQTDVVFVQEAVCLFLGGVRGSEGDFSSFFSDRRRR